MSYKINHDEFRSSIERLFFYQSEVLSSSGATITKLNHNHPDDEIALAENYYYLSECTGKKEYFGSRVYEKETFVAKLIDIRNRQYQWMLAEAYEEFKKYVVAQAKLVVLSPRLDSEQVAKFEKRINGGRDIPSSLLSFMRDNLTGFSKHESAYGSDLNLRFAYTLVRFFREQIVHERGVVWDKKSFIDKVISKSGISGKNANLSNHVYSFFGSGDNENTILLIEKPAPSFARTGAFTNDFRVLAGYLLNYSDFLMYYLADRGFYEKQA